MRKCIRCGTEMTKGFVMKTSFALLSDVELIDEDCTFNRFGTVKVAVCPRCGEISLYTEHSELLENVSNSYNECKNCNFPVYEDQKFCPHCGTKNKHYNKKAPKEIPIGDDDE